MTSKKDRLNKPEKTYEKFKVACSIACTDQYQTEPYDLGRNQAIDEMDAYYKQLMKEKCLECHHNCGI